VSETDGLEVLSGNFGPAFPNGLLVVQDGYKRLPDGPQNFKLVSWEDVARVLKLP
jgi:3-phytase